MNTIYKNKRPYTSPTIERVELDNEISLALESAPPVGPNEISLSTPEHFNNDPFKTDVG
jgi:hypothetical protein